MRTRILIIMVTVLSLVVSACSLPDSLGRTEWSGRVGEEAQRVEVAGAVVTFPQGVAPAGTTATVKVTSAAEDAPPNAAVLSSAIEITLGGDLQPSAPVQVMIHLNENAPSPTTIAEEYWLFGSATSSDGTEAFVTGAYDQGTNTFTFAADHFTSFRVLGVDVGRVMGEVHTAIMQGLGLELPAPECRDNSVEVAGSKYEVVSYPEAHLCLGNEDGNLVVTAYPALGMPYVVTSTPRGAATSRATEVNIGTAGIIAFAEALGLTGLDGAAGLFPGARASFTLDGAPAAVRLDFHQEPGLLLMMILARTLDVFGVTTVEVLQNLQCLADVVESSSALHGGLSGEAVGSFAKAFFNCAESVADLTPWGKFLLTVVGTAPALLVTAVIGMVNELTGQGSRSVDLLVTPPTRPSNHSLLNSPLPGDVCWSGEGGWLSEEPIQLVDGSGAAYQADGEFAGVGIIGTEILGLVDLNSDGTDEIVLALRCAGSPPETCCAGRSSMMLAVAVLTVAGDNRLTKFAPTLMGGASEPGDQYGPASRQITDVQLRGETVVTSESIIYADHYTADQVGGDPYALVTVEYRLTGDGWVASS